MKYLLIIVAVIALASAGLTGYLYINPDYLAVSQPISREVCPITPGTDELKANIKQLQDELFKVQNLASQQALDIAQLKSNSARIDDFYAKLKELQLSLSGVGKPGPDGKTVSPEIQAGIAEALAGTFTPEFFQNPEYAKLFVAKVEEAMKIIDEKERAEQVKRRTEQLQKRIAQRIDEFAKAQNLNDFQKTELTRIVDERLKKTQDLFSQMRPVDGVEQQFNPEDMRAKMDALRTESNEKVKQVLLPAQYEEYQKVESSLTGGGRGMGFRGPAGTPPQTPAPTPAGGGTGTGGSGGGAQPGR